MQIHDNLTWPDSNEKISESGCTIVAANRVANVAIYNFGWAMDTPCPSTVYDMICDSSLTSKDGMIFSGLKEYLAGYGVDATVSDTGKDGKEIDNFLQAAKESEDKYMIIGRLPGKDGNEDHYVNINGYDAEHKKVRASDTSITSDGTEKRDLESVDSSSFDRLIMIKVAKKVAKVEEN